jgi:pyridoxamine 5'-phosphate oxidase
MANRRQFLAVAAGAGVGIARLLTTPAAMGQADPIQAPGGNEPKPASGPPRGPSDEHTQFVMSVSADPYQLFSQWYQDAKDAGESAVNNMTLATADVSGMPDVRVMTHQGIEDGRFIFTSFADSVKGKEMQSNDKAALLFYWAKPGRQVRVRGTVRQFSKAEADRRWNEKRSMRALRLRDLAWPQSEPYQSAEELEQRLSEIEKRYPGEVPRRDWTGYWITPLSLEFYLPHPKTLLHERVRFVRRSIKHSWRGQRLAP